MASSSPRTAMPRNGSSPGTDSTGDPFPSNRLEKALDFMADIEAMGMTVAPAMPEAEALVAAALKVGIPPKDALKVYLTILHYGDNA